MIHGLSDEEKFKAVYSKLDFSDEVHIYSQTPDMWVKTEEIEKASREIFGENINILNLKYALIKDGKVEYTIPTDISIKIFKVKIKNIFHKYSNRVEFTRI